MTAEHITIVSPSDPTKMRVVCKKCHAALTLRLNETLRVPSDCPGCHEPWRTEQYGSTPKTAEAVGKAIKDWLEIERDRQPQFEIGFEINTKVTP